MNEITIIGYLGADAEVRQTTTGQVVTLRVATSERWTDANGREQERTDWHRVVAFGRQGEIAASLAKGNRVLVVGQVRYQSWEDRDGKTRWSTEIHCRRIDQLVRRPRPTTEELDPFAPLPEEGGA